MGVRDPGAQTGQSTRWQVAGEGTRQVGGEEARCLSGASNASLTSQTARHMSHVSLGAISVCFFCSFSVAHGLSLLQGPSGAGPRAAGPVVAKDPLSPVTLLSRLSLEGLVQMWAPCVLGF